MIGIANPTDYVTTSSASKVLIAQFSTKLFESVTQVGISYDLTVSQFKNARIKPQTLELSLILRSSRPDGSVPCPWK
jgi:hypothetical protein